MGTIYTYGITKVQYESNKFKTHFYDTFLPM